MAFFKETDFRETEIGRIPGEWKVEKIGQIAKTEAGGTPSTSVREYWGGDVPWINSGELRNGLVEKPSKYITKLGLESSAARLLPPNTVLIALTGATTGVVGYLSFECSTNQSVVGILPNKTSFVPKFLFYYLMHNRKRVLTYNVGSAQPHINKKIVDDFLVVLPKISEQNAIVEILDVGDSAIELADKAIMKTERLKKGMMQQLLTHGIGHTEFKETPIGKIPKSWQIMKLGDALEQCQYGLSLKFGEDGKYPILKMDDIVNGVAIPDYVKRVNLDNPTFSNFKLEKGDVLFNRTNSYEHVGRTGIFLLDGDYTFASYLIRLRPKKDALDSQFLTFYLIYSNERLKQLATIAVHQANINATNLQSLTIALPPLPEQKKIAQIIITLDQKLGLENQEKARLEQIKKGLMDLLLTGKIRIKGD